jgi:hypothetical protein
MVYISYLPNGSHTISANTPHLTGGQPNQGIFTFSYHQLGGSPGASHQLGTSILLQLDIMYQGAAGD